MIARVDRKAAMRKTLSQERRKVEDRFTAAEALLTERPGGLAEPSNPVRPVDFSAEIQDAGAASRQIHSVPVSLVHDNPLNARYLYDPEVVKSLAASIATRGQMVPATAVPDAQQPGHFVLVDGHYRKKAVIAAGRQQMDLLVVQNAAGLDLYRMSWLLNEERSAQSALDNAWAWKRLLDEHLVQEAAEIAQLLGVSAPTVNKTLALLRLPAAALDKMRERPDKFGVFIGYELTLASKVLAENELLALIDKIVAQDLSSREVEAIRSQLEKGGQRKRKEISRQYKIRVGATQVGVIKEWDSGKLSLEINLSDAKERAALLEDLKRRFHLED